ncbi:HEAT repeat domain-containing protein [Paenibacillus nicotianae]|uniref:HEAT repeat domain-containing protein n=1 Tax=Paenibacillus nicotianae TaxID=1526551 RepID=A0ABW4UUH2_9BACL
MEHIDYIQDLIYRMSVTTDEHGQAVRSSGDSVGWKARKEAQQLKEEHWIDIVDTVWTQTTHVDDRKHLFFIWSHLARHTQGTRAVDKMLLYFQSIPPREQMMLLHTFTYVPFIPDATPFLSLSYAKKSSVRHHAIEILGRCDREVVGERLIELLSISKNHVDLFYILSAIQKVNLQMAAPYLVPHLRSNKVDIRALCIDMLSTFDGNHYLSIFEHHLAKDLSSSIKWHAMKAIAEHGTPSQVKLVLKRVKSIVSRPRAGRQHLISELMYGISFLHRVASDDPAVVKWLQEVRTTKYDNLFEHEQKLLSELLAE